jgi:hypothetical protein
VRFDPEFRIGCHPPAPQDDCRDHLAHDFFVVGELNSSGAALITSTWSDWTSGENRQSLGLFLGRRNKSILE